jgi:hypothetical protein
MLIKQRVHTLNIYNFHTNNIDTPHLLPHTPIRDTSKFNYYNMFKHVIFTYILTINIEIDTFYIHAFGILFF